MEDKVVIKGEFKGSKAYFRTEKPTGVNIKRNNEKLKLDCVGLILKTIKRKRKSRK